MRKKYLSALLLGALLVTSAGTFTSCKDYDDEINNLQEQVDAVKASIKDLESKITAGNWVTSVNDVEGGFEITFNDGKKYTIANGKNGTMWRINSENNNWEYSEDGGSTWKDTSICAKGDIGPAGADGHSPYINEENGNWMIWDAEQGKFIDSEKSAIGAQTYIVEYNMYYELNVMQYVDGKPTEFATVKLPKTGTITNLEAMSIIDGQIQDNAEITLNYGKLNSEVKFNGKTYKEGSILVAKSGATLSVKVNPLDADATLYTFGLTDSKGNTPFKVSEVSQNKTEKALTRAASANKGVYDLYVDFANASNAEKINYTAAYALYTTTLNGQVASDYNVTVNGNQVTSTNANVANISDGEVGKAIDLTKCFAGGTYVDINHVVDCYFEFADKTAANLLGARIEGNTLYVSKCPVGGTNLKIKVNYLLVNGTVAEGATAKESTVSIAYNVPEASLSDINWTITADESKKNLYISVDDIKNLFGVTADADITKVTAELENLKWADGTELDKKSVVRNGVVYGKQDTNLGKTGSTFADLQGQSKNLFGKLTARIQTYNTSNNQYTDATDINSKLFIGVEFNAAEAFPGEYIAEVVFKNGSNEVLKVPVKLTITAPEMSIVKLDNYFDGNNAVAYGTATNGTEVTFDLNNLFKTANLEFEEKEYDKPNNGGKYDSWLSGDAITVPVYENDSDADHFLGVYATREYTAVNKYFGNATNPYVEYASYKFNLTVKSELFEGTFTSNFTADIINDLEIPVNAFELKDVKGVTYYLADTYVTNSEGKLELAGRMDSRIQAAERTITAADENATNYLDITPNIQSGSGKSAFFKVARKANVVLQQDTQCKLKVQFTDMWGRINSTEITVTLKKNS